VLDAEVRREKERADSKAERVDELRRALNDAKMERARLLAELESYRDLEQYLEHLARFTLYTRTRLTTSAA